jgi:hypothetical protein
MSRIFTFTLLLLISVSVYSQNYWDYNIDFEDPSQFFRLEIDTITNPNNIWQIGEPQKTIFSSAYSGSNVIITDTVNSYPMNDTSIFVIKHVSELLGGFQTPHTVILSGKYQVNSDSITDFGIMEFSPDNGNIWIDLLTDTLYLNQMCYEWRSAKPILSGNSTGWTDFYVWIAGFGPVFDIQPGDTVQYRFTFISDSIQTNKDGLMFDDFHFEDWTEGISEVQNKFETKIYPNPTSSITKIGFKNEKNETYKLVLYDSTGKNIFITKTTNQDIIIIDLSSNNSGIYFYKLLNQVNNQVSFGKIIKQE